MRTEKGVILAVYKRTERKPRFLVLKRKKNWEGWELPKGHLEESYSETVEMELREEAGITKESIKAVKDLEKLAEWSYKDGDEKVKREYKAFLVEVTEDSYVDTDQNPHDEHESGFFFRTEHVKEMLTYEDHVDVLEKAAELVK